MSAINGISDSEKDEITLDRLPIGGSGVITRVGGEGALRMRLLDMGIIPRTRVTVRKAAPLGDPIEIYLRGYELTIRLEEARNISVRAESTKQP